MLSFSSPFEEKGGEEEGDEELSRAEEGGSPRLRMSREASSRTAVALKLKNEVLNAKVDGLGVGRLVFERNDGEPYNGDPFKTRYTFLVISQFQQAYCSIILNSNISEQLETNSFTPTYVPA